MLLSGLEHLKKEKEQQKLLTPLLTNLSSLAPPEIVFKLSLQMQNSYFKIIQQKFREMWIDGGMPCRWLFPPLQL